MIKLERYTTEMRGEWDKAVDDSRNATFLHRRDFMDYHSHRFADSSLIARDSRGRIVALLPCCRQACNVVSHAGLTYGGWLMSTHHADASIMLEVTNALVTTLRSEGVKQLIYKPVPSIYHRVPSQEDLYALWRHGAQVSALGLSSTIDIGHRVPFDRGNRRNVNLALRQGVAVGPSDDWATYWQLLSDVLRRQHGVDPVHTLDEIRLLHSRFPENISLHTATLEGDIVAGVVMFDTPQVAHAQYIAAGQRARTCGALALLFDRLITRAEAAGQRYFDFGISTEHGGATLNEGLIAQKTRFGGRPTLYPTLTLQL